MCLNMYLSADSKLNSSQEHDTEGKSNPAGGPMPDLLAAENPHGKTTFLRINILLRSESWLCEVATNNCNFREFPQSLLLKDVTLVSHMTTHAPVNGLVPGTISENNDHLIRLFLGVIKE